MADRSPTAWRDLLERRLHNRWAEWKKYDDYYEGDHSLSAWLRSVQRAFQGTVLGNLLNEFVDNYMPLVVDSVAERLKVQGFRIDGSDEASPEATKIWKANGLKSQSNMVHTESVKLGDAYWLVGPDGKVTSEHPSQFIVATAPGDRRQRLAGFKKWIDNDDGFAYANLYLPEGVVKWRAPTSQAATNQGLQWVEIDRFGHGFGVVPGIPVPNNPSMLKGGRSDLAFGATALQDAIEKTVADSLIGSEYHGLPQRVLLGVEAPRDENGRVISDMEAAKSRLWYFNNPDAKAHEFSQADLKGLRELVDGFIGDLAAQTRIPIYYFRPAAISNLSAEALVGLDAGLVSKAKDKEDPFGEGHEEMMRLVFKAKGEDVTVDTIWANTESRSIAQLADAATKKKDLGVPFEQNMEDLGYSPEQIDRMQAARDEEGLLLQTPVSTNGSVPAIPSPN